VSPSADLRLHGDAYVRDGLVDFAVNVRRGRPRELRETLERALESESYPDDREARSAIAYRHGVPVERVLTLNGACEGFWLLAQALRPRRAVCVHPTFSEGESALRASGAALEHVFMRPPQWGFEPTQVTDAADFVVVTNPNNPTGHLHDAEVLAELARPGRVLLVDESFMEFARERESLAKRVDLAGLVVLRSCTKLWSLAGVRAGYLIADPKLVATLVQHRQPWPVNALACAALCFAARAGGMVERLVEEVEGDRLDLTRRLEAIHGLQVVRSVTNFLLVRAPGRRNLPALLSARGIAVRPASSFPGLDDTYFRAAVRDRTANRRLAQALQAALADA
jgi:histidinol-phosphate aminotransferase